MINNKIISDNVTIADSFNEYFLNVGKSLAQKITSTDDPLSYIDYNNLCISELVVSEHCVKTVISQLNNSAPGHDGLPPSIMKQLTNEYVIPLTHLINLSIVQGDFPSELKLANSYQYINLKRNISLRIIDLFRYCRIFLRYINELFTII